MSSPRRPRSARHTAARLLTAAAVSLAVATGVLSIPATATAAPAGSGPKPYLGRLVSGHSWKPGTPTGKTATSAATPKATKLTATTATLALPAATSGARPQTRATDPQSAPAATVTGRWQTVGSSGLAVAAAKATTGGASASKVTVDVLDASAAKKYGGGLVLRLRRADGDTGAAPVAVRVPRSLLTGMFGADYAGRVRWVQYPDTGKAATAATTGRKSVPTATSAGNTLLSPQLASGSAMMLAATSTATSSTGTGSFGATSLSPAGEWQVSAQSGDFSWSYPLRTPPAAAGPEPSLALTYDSQAVDAETGSTNNQPSAVGDGWSLAGGGFIERSYVPCSLDSGPTGPVTTSGDQCWKTDNATLSLAGHSGRLVKDSATGAWKLASDDGSRLEHLTGAANGAQGGEYWRLTTTDGTQYYFGLNQLPGWTSGNPTSNSTWTLPVYGNDPGEPCHASTFAGSGCTQAWRWNLDYVVDPHGNASAFYYTPETNLYAQNGTGGVSYVRGGHLDHIDYGLTATTVYAANAASDKVQLTYANRCSTASNCDSAHPTIWPDTPWDQNCSAAPCSQVQPTFWSTKMLTGVTTSDWTGSSYAAVDTWALGHSFPDPGDGTSAALWLTGITHTGNAGATPITLPAVTFAGAAMQNRVWATDGLAPLDKYRITSVTAETGAVTSVNYSAQQCTAANAASIEANANTNTQRCFPQWWVPQTTPPQPAKQDLFHKYVITSVINDPHTGGANDRPQETDYVYTGTPAWRYDTSPLTPDAQRTWSSYAGYNTVEVRVGDPTSPAAQQTTAYTFFQGMDGDRAATSGGTKTVGVTASDGSTVPDSLWLAGRTREARTLNGVGGAVLSDTIATAWASPVTANDGTSTARMVDDGDVVTTAPLAAGGTRRTETRTSYDSYGRVTQVDDITPDAGTTCTTTSYATNTSAWLIDFPAEVAEVGKDCAATPSYPADAVSDTRTAYDGGAVGAAPTKGDATTTQVVRGYSGSTAATATWQTTATTGYDTLGRVTSVTDPRTGTNRTTTTAYTPAGSGPLTRTVVTNPLGWTTTTSDNPAWGAETAVTDPNGHTTTASYDALGRRTGVWAPDRPQASNPTPNVAYAYTVSPSAPLSVATTTQVDDGGTLSPLTSYTLYDGLGRPRQTQAPGEIGTTVVTDTFYDAAGRTSLTNQSYATNSVTPSGTLFEATMTPSGQHTYTFDGAGRTLTDTQWVDGTKAWTTTTAYPGVDRTDTTPPAGGTPTSTWTDSRGNTTQLTDYLAATVNGTAQQETTHYSYDAGGDRTGMTDAAGNHWTWTYDVLGEQTSATDPDTGTTTTSYDAAGRATSTTDSRGTTLATTYDALDRQTALTQGTPSGPLLASWTYDTLSKGQLTSSTSYVGSTADTPGAAYTQSVTGYDAADRPTGHATTLPAGTPMAGTYTTTLAYYPDGSLYQQKDPAEGGINAETLTYGYDSLGNTYLINGSISGVGSYEYAAVGYTYLGQVASASSTRSSQSLGRTYRWADGTNRLTEAIGTLNDTTTVNDRHYSYDNVGNVTSIDTTSDSVAADNQCFTYNPLGDLTQAWTPSSDNCATTPSVSALGGPAPYWTSYTVDPATGNRTQTVEHSTTGGADTTDTYAYPATGQAHPHAVTTVTHTTGTTSTTDSYGTPDADGNTTARPGQTLSWDARGKLATLTKTATGQQQSSVYDADGNLLVQSDPVTGTTAYLGDTQLHTAAGSSTVSASRTYTLNTTPIGERDTTAGVAGSILYFLDADTVSTVTTEVRATDGAVTRRYNDPFGNPRGTAAAWSSPRGYLNAPTSSFSTLTQLGARDYDPTLGRFISPDPILDVSDVGSLAAYAYADNNPVTDSDPTGLDPIPQGCSDAACYNRYYGSTSTGFMGQLIDSTLHGTAVPGEISVRPGVAAHASTKSLPRPKAASVKPQIHPKAASAKPTPKPKPAAKSSNHCGVVGFLCDMVGVNQVWNCVTNPSWSDCAQAGFSVALDLTGFGGLGAHAAEAAGEVAVDEGSSLLAREGAAAEGGSTREILDSLPKGKQSFVRTVPDEQSLRSTFDELTRGGKPTTWKNYSGQVFELPDGTQVGMRSTSTSGGATIDIRSPGQRPQRIHIG